MRFLLEKMIFLWETVVAPLTEIYYVKGIIGSLNKRDGRRWDLPDNSA